MGLYLSANGTIKQNLKSADINMKQTIKKFFVSWRHFVEKKLSQLTLYFIYFIGIGLSAMLAKIVGKKFLTKSSSHSNWQTILDNQQKPSNLEKMY